MKQIFLILILFLSLISSAQITYFNSASTPADNGTNTATTTAVTPPGSMTTGDIVIFIAYQRGTAATIAISEASGQTWSTAIARTASSTAILTYAVFWCRYNGTWGSNPSVVFASGTSTSVVMHVFRPTNSTKVWALKDAGSSSRAAASPMSGSGLAPASMNTGDFGIAGWITDDDNTMGAIGGTDAMTDMGSAQYRNTSGSDMSSSYAYKIPTGSFSPSSFTKTQATNGNDPYVNMYLEFTESDPAPANHNGGFFKIIKRQ